jgi:serine/threonine protein kinase
MRKCETCGSPIEEAHPYRVCAKCLFEDALRSSDDPESPAHEPVGEEMQDAVLVHNLFRRKDFFQKYDLIERIGGGGQGDVWKVWDFEFCRTLAMKRMGIKALASEPALYRFLAEAQIASQLEHPGILPIFDVGLDPDGRPFYTTQLLPGTTLGDIWDKVHDAKEPDWTVAQALRLLLRVCEIMAHAHSRGVIHRDLKPANVLIGPFGDLRVIDWGSAHVLDSARDDFEESFVRFNQPVIQTDRGEALWAPESPMSTARSGQPVTILFVPPEILDGESSQVDPQTDVYSVGVILYGLLAGRFPYSQSNGVLPEPRQLGELVLNGPPAPLRSLKPGISRDLEAICATAMSRFKISRYATMLELADDIRAALELRPVKARRPGPVLKVKRFAQRHAGYVSLACLIAVIIAVGFAVAGRLQRERDVARQVQAVHDGELAGRSGHWREALSDWDLAQSAGYKDTVYLDLQRAEAWTILSEPDRSGALLKSLSQRSNLGAHKGAVLLRLGEHELFDEATARQGAQHVREALDAGLDPSDELVARGLLADSTPEALDFFHRAIKMNSFNHSAHRHSLGLEFLLGRHADLQDSIRFFSAIYPDDPSPGFLEAAEFAMQGRLKEAQARMMELRDSVGTAEWEQANDGLPAIVAAVKHFDPDAVLTNSHSAINAMDFFKAAQGVARLGASASGSHSARYPVDRFDTPKWCVDEISATTVMGGKMVALTLLTRDGKAEFHDYNVRLRNTERIHKCTKIFLPIGVAFGFLGA